MSSAKTRKENELAHIRVTRKALQALRCAIATRGGTFHGELQSEASLALENRAAELTKKAAARAEQPAKDCD